MTTSNDALAVPVADTSQVSGVSWAAVFAGATAAAALSLILIVLGFGLGFSAVSPWPGDGASLKQLSVSTVIWLMLTQILAAGLGGYLAGRLRVRWASLHDDEVYFRDTAHGFLAWALATLVTATVVVGSVSGLVGTGVHAGASLAAGAAAAQAGPHPARPVDGGPGYFIDLLFRDNRPVAVSDDAAHAVATRILLRGVANDQLPAEDRAYLAHVVAQRTELSQAQAEQRVDQVFAAALHAKQAAQQAADEARKAAAASALWMFVALLCGAFFASFLAIHGGRRRDADELPNPRPARPAQPRSIV